MIFIDVNTRQGHKRLPYRIYMYGAHILLYDEFLRRNGFSVKSSYKYERIKKYPQHFYKNVYGQWYINEYYADELKKKPKQRMSANEIKPLPRVEQINMNL